MDLVLGSPTSEIFGPKLCPEGSYITQLISVKYMGRMAGLAFWCQGADAADGFINANGDKDSLLSADKTPKGYFSNVSVSTNGNCFSQFDKPKDDEDIRFVGAEVAFSEKDNCITYIKFIRESVESKSSPTTTKASSASTSSSTSTSTTRKTVATTTTAGKSVATQIPLDSSATKISKARLAIIVLVLTSLVF